MATVGTSSLADVLAPPGNPPIVRQYPSGYLYVAMRTATDTISIYRSTDAGATWSLTWGPGATAVSFTQTGIQEWSKIVTDNVGGLHLAYRVGTASFDTIWYRRLNTTTGVWGSALQTSSSNSNGGVIGSAWTGVDVAAVKNGDGSFMIVVCGHYNGGGRYGVYAMGVTLAKTSYTPSLTNGLITGNRYFSVAGTAPGRVGVSCEIESTGDGYTSSTPHIWITWGRASVYLAKLTWQGYYTGWQGPSSPKTIRSTLASSQDYVVGRYDGTRYMMAVPSPDDTTMVRVYQRNQANTSTTTIDTPAHTTGTVKNVALSYDTTTKNLRVYAVGTTTAVLYYVDYVRATATWTSWATVVATAVTTSTEWGVKYGGSSGTAKHDVLTTAGSVNPWTVTHTQQAVSTAPAIAAFVTSGQAYTNGGPANVGAALPLAWTFSDADPGQTQGSYALSRQIGAATIAYWNAGTSTWGASETQNASVTQGVTLPSGWVGAADADLPHTYKVKVWDSTGVVAPGYSAQLVLNPSTQVNPTVTAPVAASTLTTDTVTVTWTAAEQTGARVVLVQTSPVARTVYDTGAMMGFTDTSYTVPVRLDNATAWTVTLYTYNAEGLASAAQTKAFSVAYAAPPAVVCTPTASTTLGLMSVATSALTPVGTQPAIVSVDVYRRVKTASTLISNGDFNGSTTGFTGSGGTLSYSTTQFHSSPGAARVVPGGSADALVLLATPPDVTAGIAAGKQYTVSGWMRPDTANKPIRDQTSFYNSSGTFLSQQGQTFASVVAGAWHYVEFTGDPSAVSTAAKVGSVLGLASIPAVGDAYYLDDVVLREANTDTGIRIAAGIAVGTTLTDWGASANTDYEYRAVATGANGTSIAGPWAG
jgi:hypothetical protein